MSLHCRFIILAVVTVIFGGCAGLKCSSSRHLTRQEGSSRSSRPPLVSSISASSYNSLDPPEELFAFDLPHSLYAWCHSEDQPTGSEINVTISMTEPVLLYGILSGGYDLSDGFYRSYVTAFSLDYSYNGTAAETSMVLDVTDVSVSTGPNDIPLALLPEAIVMDTLHLEVVDYFSINLWGRACWTVALLGCLLSEAQEEPPPALTQTSYSSMFSSTTYTPTPTPSPAVDSPSEAEGLDERRDSGSDVAAAAASTAVVTVVAVALIVAVGVGLCWAITRRQTKRSTGSDHTPQRVRNRYTDCSPNRAAVDEGRKEPGPSSTDTEVQKTDLVYSYPAVSTGLRPVTSKITEPGTYEAVQSPDDDDDSLTENSAYLTTSAENRADHFTSSTQNPAYLATSTEDPAFFTSSTQNPAYLATSTEDPAFFTSSTQNPAYLATSGGSGAQGPASQGEVAGYEPLAPSPYHTTAARK